MVGRAARCQGRRGRALLILASQALRVLRMSWMRRRKPFCPARPRPGALPRRYSRAATLPTGRLAEGRAKICHLQINGACGQ